jgi:hypothetical protein
LRRGADPTKWTSSPSSSARSQPWSAAPHLPTRSCPYATRCRLTPHNKKVTTIWYS